MKRQKLTKVHLSDNRFNKLRAMSYSLAPSADFRKSIRRQFSVYAHSEPTKKCQITLLVLVVFQFILIVGAIVIFTFFPTIIYKYLMNSEKTFSPGKAKCWATGIH